MFKKQKKTKPKANMQKKTHIHLYAVAFCFPFFCCFAFVSFFFLSRRWKIIGAHISYSDPAPKRDITRYTRVGVSE